MLNFSDEVEEIKSLINSNYKENKSVAYSSLLHLQEQSNNHSSSVQALANSSHTLIASITADISIDDEEIAVQALKCLGFMIYHPSIVATIPDGDASMMLEALTEVIAATKIKSVCNLGMWCISMQQFEAAFLSNHFQTLLRAVVHALDNPFGSLSTTFEALQVVMKLATQLIDKMREFSFIWVPPIYRRLLSIDKREREMSARCLSKIKQAIFPPTVALSKVIAKDIKWKLLSEMKGLLNQSMKVQSLQAWGWYIRLLGSQALKNRHLINDMLKIPEQTFSDNSSQVQIASQVAWEGLIDALIPSSVTSGEVDNEIQQLQASSEKGCQVRSSVFMKSIKLIMTPLIGIISSKCDTSVHLSCLNTWCYLLHKLSIFIKHPSVVELVLTPIFKSVFGMDPDTKNSLLWNLCLDLVDDFILARCAKQDYESSSQVIRHSPATTSVLGPSLSSICLVKQHPIKWFPWSIAQLDLFISIINIILSHASIATTTPQNRSSACDAALRLFRSLLKGVHIELKSLSISYADIMLYLNTILSFIKDTCHTLNSGGSSDNKLQHSFQFLEVVIDEIGPAILGSPLYKVPLDLECIKNLQFVNDVRYEGFLDISSLAYMDMVSPLHYLIILSICAGIQSTSHRPRVELSFTVLQKFFKLILFSYDSLENLQVAIGFLFKYTSNNNLKIWIAIAEALRDCIASVKDRSLLRMEPHSNACPALYHLLSYPFVVRSCVQQIQNLKEVSCSSEESHILAQGCIELEHVIKAWNSVYGAFSASQCSAMKGISDNLCLMLNWCIDESLRMNDLGSEVDLSLKDQYLDLLSLSGNAVTCMIEEILAARSDGNHNNHAEPPIYSDIKNILEFASRFLKLSSVRIQVNPFSGLPVISRLFSSLTRLTSRLRLKHTILSTIETITLPLIQWLSHERIHDGRTNDQVQNLWAEVLVCLRRSQPPIVFDSSFLKLQAPLLAKTVDHPNSAISELTVTFWNSTYGEQIKLDYPENLLDILNKLSRNKRIILHKKTCPMPFLMKCNSTTELTVQNHRVTATHTGCSKRVELLQDVVNQSPLTDKFSSGPKRKRLELTEHQREVRRAQQGRAMDCSGHGPGIRTYTTADFSQGNEDSQDMEEIQNPESILQMLRGL
ncbi:uncharacterized protein LOC126654003 [Mercurialis annua]|uniref:uncharacterized protein LOC126654003 n=1 Tax=Mercurialis annua TaxID=3986 RepID=UPI002160F96E|nr:uncharacterized protein LOC126654003 [Mercurialis annua]